MKNKIPGFSAKTKKAAIAVQEKKPPSGSTVSRIPLQQLKIAKQEGISTFLANQQAYYNRASSSLKANPSERVLQEMSSARQDLKEQKKKEILTNMLWKNNSCNKDLSMTIETGATACFDSPPMIFSPVKEQTQPIEGDHFFGQRKKPVSPQFSDLWATIAQITPSKVTMIKSLKNELEASKVKQQNLLIAFTFGKKIHREDIGRQDFKSQFDHLFELHEYKNKFAKAKKIYRSDKSKSFISKDDAKLQRLESATAAMSQDLHQFSQHNHSNLETKEMSFGEVSRSNKSGLSVGGGDLVGIHHTDQKKRRKSFLS